MLLRNPTLLLLFCGQALYWSCSLIGITLTSLVGVQLAPLNSLATLPLALLVLGNLLAVQPLSHFMQRHGSTSRADARRRRRRARRPGLRRRCLDWRFPLVLSRRAGHRGLPGLGHVLPVRRAGGGGCRAERPRQRLRARRRSTRRAAGAEPGAVVAQRAGPALRRRLSADRRAGPRRPAADGPAPRRPGATPGTARLARHKRPVAAAGGPRGHRLHRGSDTG